MDDQVRPLVAQNKFHTKGEWQAQRPVISQMYVQRMKQEDIMQRLAQMGFPITKSQLKRRVHDWNLQRNIKREEYLPYFRQNKQHLRPGEKRAFIMRGRVVEDHKIARAYQRFGAEINSTDDPESSDQAGTIQSSCGTFDSSVDSAIGTPPASDGQQAPAAMLNSEYFIANVDDLGEIRDVLALADLFKFAQPPSLSTTRGVENDMRRLQSMQLLSNAFLSSFLVQDRESQLMVCLNMWRSANEFYSQSRPREVEFLQSVVVEWLPRLVAKSHPYLVSSVGLLASACGEQAKYIEAEENHLEQLERAKFIHGPKHSMTLVSQHHLATLYMHTGRLRQALDHAQAAYDVQYETLGENHLETLYTFMTIGGIALRDRRYHEAQKILEHVAKEFQKQLGEKALFTFRVEQELARCLFESGDLSGSRKVYEDSVRKQAKYLGVDHHETVSGMVRLARILVQLEEYDEAERNLLHAVNVFEKSNGSFDPVTIRARLELAAAYEGQKNMEAVLLTQQRVSEDNAGRAHKCPWILKGMAHSAWRYHQDFGMKPEAIKMQKLVVEMSELQLEPPEETAKYRIKLQLMQEE